MNKPRFFSSFIEAWKKTIHDGINIKKAYQKAGIAPRDRQVVMNRVFTLPAPLQLPTTPVTPCPNHVLEPPSSPLGPGGSQRLVKRVRSNQKNPTHVVCKMNKRIVSLEAENALLKKSNSDLRGSLKMANKKRAFKPIVPGHQAKHAKWIGSEEVRAAKEAREAEAAREEAEKQDKQARKEARALAKADKEAEQARKRAEREEKRRGQERVEGMTIHQLENLARMALSQATSIAGPSSLG
ncbi:hypothetical protein TREMEDRAFT_60809 [Tremella mesenterica DSM 1558]|uniref:uncharacterized protein n=1 Tax=Tremella mesenterica (strain ATCC 24925 / CBS 8224 / DSM 1558 / NBRC 9311 / NRRL Y-6157 / RJB 2259-6 / UBC 559-6) TaxID=578456 RepID=UPI0003F49814|nr:uncharacterized protein TREMEDRAFT_60809 [Tremella mesenterica DSM 1558]EIW70319.1 hypothetical protein TREMEDRAFT_60809 [Tremella mesenterica DSM 1558]